MADEERYKEFEQYLASGEPDVEERARNWSMAIGLQDAAELNVSAFLLDLAVRNVKGEITREEVSQRLREHYGDTFYDESKTGLDGGYEIIPPGSPIIEEIEEYNRKLRPALYAELDKNRNSRNLR